MSRRHLFLLIVGVLCVFSALPVASRAQTETVTEPAWATINSCGPNAVGVRAQLRGESTGAVLFARFNLEWHSSLEDRWLPVEGPASSPWLQAGSPHDLFGQTGWTFDVEAPPPGASFKLRGVAQLQWRRGGEVLREERRVTSGGLPGVDEGSPPGTSLGSCTL